MTLEEFLKCYGNNACISIDGYCEEASYDYITIPSDYHGRPNEKALSDNMSCFAKEPWWEKVKDKTVKHWNIIGGGAYKVELTISLENEDK